MTRVGRLSRPIRCVIIVTGRKGRSRPRRLLIEVCAGVARRRDLLLCIATATRQEISAVLAQGCLGTRMRRSSIAAFRGLAQPKPSMWGSRQPSVCLLLDPSVRRDRARPILTGIRRNSSGITCLEWLHRVVEYTTDPCLTASVSPGGALTSLPEFRSEGSCPGIGAYCQC